VATPTREELEEEVVRLGGMVADLERRLAEREVTLADQADRLKKLEELVEQVRRKGKRQSAPFSTLCRRRHNVDYADLRIMPTWGVGANGLGPPSLRWSA